jgi:hypothetical protein
MMGTFVDVLVSVDIFAVGEGISFEGSLELIAVNELDEIFMGLGKHGFEEEFRMRMKVF